MSTNKSRLDKLSTQLTSRQQVYMLIDKSREFNTMDDFIAWFMQEENQPKLKGIFDQSAEAVKAQMKGNTPEAIREAVRQSYREGQFLFGLNNRVAFSFHSDFYKHAYNGLMLVDMLRAWSLESAVHEGERTIASLQDITDRLKVWKQQAIQHLYHLFHDKLLAEAISNKHFGGRQLLFENDRKKLEQFITQAEKLVAGQNDSVETSLGMLKASEFNEFQAFIPNYQACLVDVEAILAEVKADLPEAIEREEQMARMDVYSSEEQHEKAFAIFREYGTVPA